MTEEGRARAEASLRQEQGGVSVDQRPVHARTASSGVRSERQQRSLIPSGGKRISFQV